ncbi:putative fatty acyl-CoA reductase 4, partial [Mucuna pruriens]
MTMANIHGWPNTYVFTKAMGEMLVMNMKDALPLIIIRPTIVISTYLEPFPGWIEGLRTIDFVVVNYGEGTVTSFVGNPKTILDVIPVDMVVNFMIVASMALSEGLSQNLVYHIGSSSRNPFKLSNLVDVMYCYFTNNPLINKYGKPVVVAKKLTLSSTRANEFNQHKVYCFHESHFDAKNVESLTMVAKGSASMDAGFNFDPKSINWKDYVMDIHFPGLVKNSIKALPIGSKIKVDVTLKVKMVLSHLHPTNYNTYIICTDLHPTNYNTYIICTGRDRAIDQEEAGINHVTVGQMEGTRDQLTTPSQLSTLKVSEGQS